MIQRGIGWSFKIGRVFGIELRLHVTFLLFLAWIALSQGMSSDALQRGLTTVALMLMVFTCVLLHELGHALAARRYGIQTRDIVLMPIGGVARLERMPEKPSQELIVALAGPAVNVVIASLVFGISAIAGSRVSDLSFTGNVLSTVFSVNVVMLLFNLIPAFPMDGGRVLRAILASRMPYANATRIAATVGQVVAVGFAAVGIFTNEHMLLFIALFVFIAAGEERAAVNARTAISALTVRDAMQTGAPAVNVDDPLRVVVDHLGAGGPQDFPVLESGAPVGVLTHADLVAALPQGGPDRRVGDVFRRTDLAADAAEPLQTAMARMRTAYLAAMPVLESGRLVGLLTLSSIAELLSARGALLRSGRPRQDDATRA